MLTDFISKISKFSKFADTAFLFGTAELDDGSLNSHKYL